MKKYDDITPAPLADQSLIGNIVFDVPIAVIVTPNMADMEQIDSLSMTLESVIKQPGVNPANVYVYHDGTWPLVVKMAKLFKFHAISVDTGPSDSFTDIICKYTYAYAYACRMKLKLSKLTAAFVGRMSDIST